MAIQSFQLDPNAQSYTDNEIVDKVNTATNAVSRSDAIDGAALGACDADDVAESATKKWAGATGADFVVASNDLDDILTGTTNVHFTATDDTKLGTIEDSATADQSGDEIITAIDAGATAITREDALSQNDMKLVKTAPVSGEYQVKNIHRDSSGKLDVEYEDTPEP